MALCKTPLLTLPYKIAESIRSISAAESALNAALPDWKSFLSDGEQDIETGPNAAYGVTRDIFDKGRLSTSAEKALSHAGSSAHDIMDLYNKWIQEQIQFKESFIQEAAAIGKMDEAAARRKHDYTPAIYNSVKTLAEEGVLKHIIEESRSS